MTCGTASPLLVFTALCVRLLYILTALTLVIMFMSAALGELVGPPTLECVSIPYLS